MFKAVGERFSVTFTNLRDSLGSYADTDAHLHVFDGEVQIQVLQRATGEILYRPASGDAPNSYVASLKFNHPAVDVSWVWDFPALERVYPRESAVIDGPILVEPDPPALLNAHRIYFGVGTTAAGPSTIEQMYSNDSTVRDFVATFSPNAQKLYVAHPKGWGVATIIMQGFALDELEPRTLVLRDTNVESAEYTVHESTYLLTGTGLSFKVTF